MKSYFSTNRVLAVTIAAVGVATLFFACKKEVTTDTASNNENDNNTLVVASHEAQAQGIYGDLFETAAIAAVDQNVAGNVRKADYEDYANVTACPSILISSADPNVWPKKITIDYGDACRDNYGITRSGKMYITLTGLLFNNNTHIDIQLDGYKYNGIPVAGKNSISGISYNATTGIQYTTEITGGRISYSDTLIVGYTSKKTVKQTAGAGTPTPNDNVYSIEGNASINYEKGGPAGNATIASQTPLLKANACKWVSQGKALVAYGSLSATIDYGNGVCDDKATITINGDKVREVTLK
ncbi:hypothetical protein HF324_27820 [Chitinophaga oryzae]|uniref:Lipoprotein n=1 Tax=Chitinophaga oryzae TaxID=2725414 RepID=A0ABX6LMU7_9BACT|nr:hypothetical protein [Chitinophaga oryzae]QJB41444.1 hypothetical protein HF324_27820 [Chitinophaga oryzae]